MKVLLINSMPKCAKERPVLPLGLLSIATYLTLNGHTVRIYDRTVERTGIKKVLKSFLPDIAGVSVISTKSFTDGIQVSKAVKKMNVPVVWGGLTTSLVPEVILRSGVVDYIVVGEGEVTALDLLGAFAGNKPMRRVDGLAFIENDEIIINKERAPADLSVLPAIDFGFVDAKKYILTNINNKKVLHTYTSKGCVCGCAYCFNPVFSNRIWRARPPSSFLSEANYLVKNFGVDSIYFTDDLLSPNTEYTKSFCREIKESGISFFWGCDMRADTCSKEELQMMHDAGCRWIFFGIESGSERIQKMVDKRLNLDKAKEVIAYCAEIGIVTTTSFIAGFPDETVEDFKQTIDYARQLKSKVKIMFSFGPIPKSALYDKLVEQNRLNAPQSYREFEKLKWFDSFGKNYSRVPALDCKVVTSYFMLSIISQKQVVDDSEKRIWIMRLLRQASSLVRQGSLRSIRMLFSAVREFLEVVFYGLFFPEIRKKYGLSYSRKVQN